VGVAEVDILNFLSVCGSRFNTIFRYAGRDSWAPLPAQPSVGRSFPPKADLVQALKDAVAYCNKAYTGMTDAKASEMIKLMGRDAPRLTALSLNSAHSDEHYGNMVTYLRLKGIVPPTSEPSR